MALPCRLICHSSTTTQEPTQVLTACPRETDQRTSGWYPMLRNYPSGTSLGNSEWHRVPDGYSGKIWALAIEQKETDVRPRLGLRSSNCHTERHPEGRPKLRLIPCQERKSRVRKCRPPIPWPKVNGLTIRPWAPFLLSSISRAQGQIQAGERWARALKSCVLRFKHNLRQFCSAPLVS